MLMQTTNQSLPLHLPNLVILTLLLLQNLSSLTMDTHNVITNDGLGSAGMEE